MIETDETQPALLTRTQIDWLQHKIQLSNGYQRKIKSDIRKKLRIFNELELPLLVKSGFITATANSNAVTTNCNNVIPENSSIQNSGQNMVGRKGLNLFTI
jgi:hypothetical protein